MELMEVGGDYRATSGMAKPPSEAPPRTEVQKPKPKKVQKPKPKKVQKPKPKKEIEKPVAAKKPVKKKEPTEEQKQYATEALLTAGDGKIRVVLNYPLAVMFCFMAVVIVICAVLVGWKLGKDRSDETYRELLEDRPEGIERKMSDSELEEPANELDE